MIYIELEEEYGYREWIWAYPGTPAEAMADWKAGRRPLGFFGSLIPDRAAFNAMSRAEREQVIGIKGTLHSVSYTYVWSRAAAELRSLSPPKFHCRGRGRDNFCDACSEVTVVEVVEVGDALEERPFPLTNLKQFAGRGHVHEEDDTFLTIGDETCSDEHRRCPAGCARCRCGGHTKGHQARCRVCEASLCEMCAEFQPMCEEHSAIDVLGAIEREETP